MSHWTDEYMTLIEAGRQPSAKQVEALEAAWERATARG